jgi:hypothetical protein
LRNAQFADKADRWVAIDGSHFAGLIELNCSHSPDAEVRSLQAYFLEGN